MLHHLIKQFKIIVCKVSFIKNVIDVIKVNHPKKFKKTTFNVTEYTSHDIMIFLTDCLPINVDYSLKQTQS